MALRDTAWVIGTDTGRSLQTSNALLVSDYTDRTVVELLGGGGTYVHRVGSRVYEWIALAKAAAVAAKAIMDSAGWTPPWDSNAFSVGIAETNRVLGSYVLTATQAVDSWALVPPET